MSNYVRSESTVKAYDTAVVFTGTLKTDDTPIDLTGATVKFLLKRSGTEFGDTATIVSATSGTVSYSPGPTFPKTPGRWQQEWEVTFSDDSILTFPSDGYNFVTILRDLNGE